jgi:hypothetical protein
VADRLLYAVRNRDEANDPVKFGVTTNFERRIVTLQVGSPYPLAKIALVPGGVELERAVHLLLSPWRTSGEWFSLDSRLTRFAKLLKKDEFRNAVIRWGALPEDFRRFVRVMIGMTDDMAWLDYFSEPLGAHLPRLFVFIDQCASHSKSPRTHPPPGPAPKVGPRGKPAGGDGERTFRLNG